MKNSPYRFLLTRRTIRRFQQRPVPRMLIRKAIIAGAYAPSVKNLQFLEYLVLDRQKSVERIFPLTRWAGYIFPHGTPQKNEHPPVFVVVLVNTKKSENPDMRDIGAACENILLSFWAFGVATCWIASIERDALRRILKIPGKYQIDSVIAAGYPKQKSTVFRSDKSVKYWQNARGDIFVPKRPLGEIFSFYDTK